MALEDRHVLDPVNTSAPPPPPVRDRLPFVCYAVLAGSVAMYFLDPYFARPVVEGGVSRGMLPGGALYGPLVAQGEWWRMLWMVLEHGGLLHLVLNMSVLWTLGRALEQSVGSGRFFLISLVTTLGSSTFALLFSFDVPTVGASGMILGWAGAMLPVATRAGRQSLVTWLVQVALLSLIPGVSWQGHLGGFVYGVPCGWALRGGATRFRYLAPVLLFLAAAGALFVGSGRFRFD